MTQNTLYKDKSQLRAEIRALESRLAELKAGLC